MASETINGTRKTAHNKPKQPKRRKALNQNLQYPQRYKKKEFFKKHAVQKKITFKKTSKEN